jgi:hypothetical protein
MFGKPETNPFSPQRSQRATEKTKGFLWLKTEKAVFRPLLSGILFLNLFLPTKR